MQGESAQRDGGRARVVDLDVVVGVRRAGVAALGVDLGDLEVGGDAVAVVRTGRDRADREVGVVVVDGSSSSIRAGRESVTAPGAVICGTALPVSSERFRSALVSLVLTAASRVSSESFVAIVSGCLTTDWFATGTRVELPRPALLLFAERMSASRASVTRALSFSLFGEAFATASLGCCTPEEASIAHGSR